MHTEVCQISNLRSLDVSKEIVPDLVREDVAKFNNKFYHFQDAALEMFKRTFRNYSVLKLLFFFLSALTLLQCIVKISPMSIMQLIRTPNHIFYQGIAPK